MTDDLIGARLGGVGEPLAEKTILVVRENLSPERATHLGIQKIIMKPYTTRHLAEAVREVLDRGRVV